MATFPLLKTGAICQYPLTITYQQGAQVLKFLDGGDQRFLRQGRQFRQWEIRLDLLDESEVSAIQRFFEGELGDYSTFDFLDPFSNRLVAKCCLGDPELHSEYVQEGRAATSLWIVETNG